MLTDTLNLNIHDILILIFFLYHSMLIHSLIIKMCTIICMHSFYCYQIQYAVSEIWHPWKLFRGFSSSGTYYSVMVLPTVICLKLPVLIVSTVFPHVNVIPVCCNFLIKYCRIFSCHPVIWMTDHFCACWPFIVQMICYLYSLKH